MAGRILILSVSKDWPSSSLPPTHVITTIAFVVPFCGYDQHSFRTDEVWLDSPTRITESAKMLLNILSDYLDSYIRLFRLLLQKKHALISNLVVVFSKRDLFVEKLQTIPFEKYCRNLKGAPPNNPGCVKVFIRDKFVDIAKENRREIQVYTANLTGTESVKPIMKNILNQSWQHRLKMDSLRRSFLTT